MLFVQRELASLEDSIKAAAGVRELLGELLLKAKKITPVQLDAALEEQRKSGEKIGTVLIRLGMLSEHELKRSWPSSNIKVAQRRFPSASGWARSLSLPNR